MQKEKRLVLLFFSLHLYQLQFFNGKSQNEAVDISNSIKTIKSALFGLRSVVWTILDQSHRQQMTLGVSFPPRRLN